MLFRIAKKCAFLQNMVVNIVSSFHPSIMHNLSKLEMLKKALFLCEVEEVKGGYFEFGVYEGTSMLAAIKLYRKLKPRMQRTFYGFDSFDEGFKYSDDRDRHPFFKEGDFVSSYEKVKKRLSKYANVVLVKGFFEDTVAGKDPKEICQDDECAVVFIDCDLMTPALIALEFIRPLLRQGSIIILDDFFAYRGSESLGTCGALNRFLAAHKEVKVRPWCPYGCGGQSFIVTNV